MPPAIRTGFPHETTPHMDVRTLSRKGTRPYALIRAGRSRTGGAAARIAEI
ncbi:hypothetical protein [Streptomyces sp. NPDC055036]